MAFFDLANTIMYIGIILADLYLNSIQVMICSFIIDAAPFYDQLF